MRKCGCFVYLECGFQYYNLFGYGSHALSSTSIFGLLVLMQMVFLDRGRLLLLCALHSCQRSSQCKPFIAVVMSPEQEAIAHDLRPRLYCMDSTFQVIKHGYPMYAMVAQDRYGICCRYLSKGQTAYYENDFQVKASRLWKW